MENKNTTGFDSKYAKKWVLRRSRDGGKDNPMPTPFSFDYFPTHVPRYALDWKNNPIMKHENRAFLTPKEYPIPKIRLQKTIKYSHHEMNYSGCDNGI